MDCSKTRHSITALLLSVLMLGSTLAGATETAPYSVKVDASCQIHVAADELDSTAVERQTSDCEHHQCCLPHGTSATLAHQALPALRDCAAKWRFPPHIHAPSLATRPPVPPPNHNGLS